MKKILVIDDNTDMLSAVDLVLTQNHYIVKTISRWPKIQKTIDSFKPDLILLDIDLDGADGGVICKRLKKDKAHAKLPIILFSAYNMPESYIRIAGAEGFLHKPFESFSLIKIIRSNLSSFPSQN